MGRTKASTVAVRPLLPSPGPPLDDSFRLDLGLALLESSEWAGPVTAHPAAEIQHPHHTNSKAQPNGMEPLDARQSTLESVMEHKYSMCSCQDPREETSGAQRHSSTPESDMHCPLFVFCVGVNNRLQQYADGGRFTTQWRSNRRVLPAYSCLLQYAALSCH